MKTAALVVQMLIRIAGIVLIVLGALFWTGHALNLIPFHMNTGVIFVLLLWVLSALAIYARVNLGLAILTIVWGLLVAVVGMAMPSIMMGGAHPDLIGVIHLLIGLIGMGLAESLGARMKRKSVASSAGSVA